MKKRFSLSTTLTLLILNSSAQAIDISAIEAAASKEGKLYSTGMPDSWANWVGTWTDLETKFNINHQDTDLNSAQSIAKMEAEGKNATADIADVGHSFAPIAVKKGVTQPYKTSYWNDIPAWAKDEEGHVVLSYTGTIAFISNNELVPNPPKTWKAMLDGDYKISLGAVGASATANSGILAAAIALGGSEKNIKPALEFFAALAKQGRLAFNDPGVANLEKGEVELAILFDFNALNYRHQIDANRFTVTIPQDGSLTTGFSTIINKHAQNPNAAKLAREYILSDAGQINLAEGFARPIRSNVKLPARIAARLLPNEQYKSARPLTDFAAWDRTSRKLARQWNQYVLIHQQ